MESENAGSLLMDAGEWVSIVAPFYTAIGEVVEEFSRKTIAEIDVSLLRLEREKLTEKLDDARRAIAKAADLEAKNKLADLARSSLHGSSMKVSVQNSVDTRSAEILEKMHREYNRAIEKLALYEQKVNARNSKWWVKLLRLFGA